MTPHPTRRRALVILALLWSAAACTVVRHPGPSADTALRVGTSGDYPPFSVRTADGSYAGFDVAIARTYAVDRGRRLELVPFKWPELAARLAAGDFDVAMSGVTVRGDRLLVGAMTAAVARADAVLLVRAGEGGDVDRSGRRIAVNRGGHLERVTRARFRRATIVPVDDNLSLPALLRDREVDAIVTDTLEAATYDRGEFTVAMRLARDRKAYWVAPGKQALADDLDAWLLAHERDGTLPRLRAVELHVDDATVLAPALANVVDLAARRLLVMPQVAAAKRAAGLPLVDPVREEQVIARAGERAVAAGLDADAARTLARAQITAARAVQAVVPPDAANRAGDVPSLATIRAAIDGLDTALVHALVAARADHVAVRRSALAEALRDDADLPGFDEAHAGAIAAGIAEVLRAPH